MDLGGDPFAESPIPLPLDPSASTAEVGGVVLCDETHVDQNVVIERDGDNATFKDTTRPEVLTLNQLRESNYGFENRYNSTMSFDNGTRTFTIQPRTTEFYIQEVGNVRYKKTAPETLVISTRVGWHWIYYSAGVLAESSIKPVDNVTVAAIYFNGTSQIHFGDERRSTPMDKLTKFFLDAVIPATRYFTTELVITWRGTGTGELNRDAQVWVSNGNLLCGDFTVSITRAATPTLPFQQELGTAGIGAKIPVYWRTKASPTAAMVWHKASATRYPMRPYNGVTGNRIGYNKYEESTGVWTLADPGYDDAYLIYWIVATCSQSEPIIAVPGIHVATTLEGARDANGSGDPNLYSGGWPWMRSILLGRLIVKTNETYANAIKAYIPQIDTGDAPYSGANNITTNVSVFDKILSVADTNVQLALNTLDDHTHADLEGAAVTWKPGVASSGRQVATQAEVQAFIDASAVPLMVYGDDSVSTLAIAGTLNMRWGQLAAREMDPGVVFYIEDGGVVHNLGAVCNAATLQGNSTVAACLSYDADPGGMRSIVAYNGGAIVNSGAASMYQTAGDIRIVMMTGGKILPGTGAIVELTDAAATCEAISMADGHYVSGWIKGVVDSAVVMRADASGDLSNLGPEMYGSYGGVYLDQAISLETNSGAFAKNLNSGCGNVQVALEALDRMEPPAAGIRWIPGKEYPDGAEVTTWAAVMAAFNKYHCTTHVELDNSLVVTGPPEILPCTIPAGTYELSGRMWLVSPKFYQREDAKASYVVVADGGVLRNLAGVYGLTTLFVQPTSAAALDFDYSTTESEFSALLIDWGGLTNTGTHSVIDVPADSTFAIVLRNGSLGDLEGGAGPYVAASSGSRIYALALNQIGTSYPDGWITGPADAILVYLTDSSSSIPDTPGFLGTIVVNSPSFLSSTYSAFFAIIGGGTPATSGTLRLPKESSIKSATNFAGDANLIEIDTFDTIKVGDTAQSLVLQADDAVKVNCAHLTFDKGLASFNIWPEVDTSSEGVAGKWLQITGQNMLGDGTTGGGLGISSATGAVGDGDVNIGTGDDVWLSFTSNGQITVQAGATIATSGTGNIDLPNNSSARFKIGGSEIGETVTATALNALTASPGSDGSPYHRHNDAGWTRLASSSSDWHKYDDSTIYTEQTGDIGTNIAANLFPFRPVRCSLSGGSWSYCIVQDTTACTLDSGTAQGAGSGSDTIVLQSGASGSDDYYNGAIVDIVSGSGSGQQRRITDYNGTSKEATVDAVWSTAVDATSVYRMWKCTTLLGAPIGTNTVYLDFGSTEKLVEYTFTFEGAAPSNDDDLVQTTFHRQWFWTKGYGFAVAMVATAAAAVAPLPRFNFKNVTKAANIFTDNSNAGLEPGTAFTHTVEPVSAPNYQTNPGEQLELTVDNNGSGTCTDANVTVLFVLQ